MSHDFAGRDEFAAAIVYLRAGSRMNYTFETIYDHIKSLKVASQQTVQFTKRACISTLKTASFGDGSICPPNTHWIVLWIRDGVGACVDL